MTLRPYERSAAESILDRPGDPDSDVAIVARAALRLAARPSGEIADAFHDALCPVSHHDSREVYAAAMRGETQPCRVKYDRVAATLDAARPAPLIRERLHPDDGYSYEECNGPSCRAIRAAADQSEPLMAPLDAYARGFQDGVEAAKFDATLAAAMLAKAARAVLDYDEKERWGGPHDWLASLIGYYAGYYAALDGRQK